jgi:hypothetical protein
MVPIKANPISYHDRGCEGPSWLETSAAILRCHERLTSQDWRVYLQMQKYKKLQTKQNASKGIQVSSKHTRVSSMPVLDAANPGS